MALLLHIRSDGIYCSIWRVLSEPPAVYTSTNLKPVPQQGPSCWLTAMALLPKSPHNHTRPDQQILSAEKASQQPCRTEPTLYVTTGIVKQGKAWPGSGQVFVLGWEQHSEVKGCGCQGILIILCFHQSHQTNFSIESWQLSALSFHLVLLCPPSTSLIAMQCSVSQDRVTLYSSGWSGTSYVAQDNLKLSIYMPPKWKDYRHVSVPPNAWPTRTCLRGSLLMGSL